MSETAHAPQPPHEYSTQITSVNRPQWQIDNPPHVTYQGEMRIVGLLQAECARYELRVTRHEAGPKSPWDITVYDDDLRNPTYGREVARIDCEHKYKDVFPENGGYPARWSRGVSFLERKMNRCDPDHWFDVYLLFDTSDPPRFIWAMSKTILECGVSEGFGRRDDRFLTIRPENCETSINYGLHSLAAWLSTRRDARIISHGWARRGVVS